MPARRGPLAGPQAMAINERTMHPGDTSSHSSLTGAVLSPNTVTMRSGADLISALPAQPVDSRRDPERAVPAPVPTAEIGVQAAVEVAVQPPNHRRRASPTSGPFIVAGHHHNYVDGVVWAWRCLVQSPSS